MTAHRALWESTLFSLIRLSPIVAPATIVPVLYDDPAIADLILKRLLALLVTLVFWNMTEGAAILWMRAKNQGSERERSYLLVTMLCGIVTVAFLQYGRSLSTQGIFLLTLATLSIRGMSRTGWENARPLAGFVGAIMGNSLLALASLFCITPTFYWQSVVVAVAIGSSVAAVEASWYTHTVSKEAFTRWAGPLLRATLALGPIIIATMAMSNQIPLSYALTCLVLPPITQVLRRANAHGTIPSTTLTGAAGIYLLFLTIMTVCASL
jgi:hypothetical protein